MTKRALPRGHGVILRLREESHPDARVPTLLHYNWRTPPRFFAEPQNDISIFSGAEP